jgi:hypothetical protein
VYTIALLAAPLADAGTMAPWTLSAPWTALNGVYNQPMAAYIQPTQGNQFCSVAAGYCDVAFVVVTIRHPSQAQIQPYVNLQGNGMTLNSTETLADGSLRYQFQGVGNGSSTPVFSVHVKSNSGADIVINPAAGHLLKVEAANSY